MDNNTTSQQTLKKFFNRKNAIVFALVIIMLATVLWGLGIIGSSPEPIGASEIKIQALDGDSLGIESETAFLLESKQPLDADTVKEALRTDPEFSYTLDKQNGGREYKIIPEEKLDPNKIYVLSFDQEGMEKESFSWAFQTKAAFRVIRALPSDKSSHVPVNTGIEITFSHENYDISKIQEYFSIAPSVQGTFEKHKKTVAFVPKALQPSTVYTVTLKKGLPLEGTTETLGEDYVFSFETGPIEQARPKFEFHMDTNLTEFGTADTPAFSVYFYQQHSSDQNTVTPPPLHIDLYRYPSHEEFQASLEKRDLIPRWSYFAWNGYKEDINPAYKLTEYDTEFLSVNNYTHYIVFPEELDAGYYAAEFSAGDTIRQIWFQVSDLAVYLAQGEDTSLFWVNDLQTGKPAPDVELLIESKNLSLKGDSSGAVFVREPLISDERDYALVKNGSLETLVPLEARPQWNEKKSVNASDFWKYFYLDRELYQPGDTVNFWGVLAPRGKNDAKEITLELWGSDGAYYEGAEASPILSQGIPVNDKTYTGQLKLPVLKPGYYYIQVKIGDVYLFSRGFSIETYQKPTYKLTLSQDKKAIFAGEKLTFQAETSFFEGTPVPGLKLNYFIEDKRGTVTANEKGESSITYVGATNPDDTSAYRYVSIGVNAALPEYGEIYASSEFYVFKSQFYLAGEAARQGDRYTLTATLSKVDLSGINNGQYLAEENFLEGSVANSAVKGSLYQEVWTKVESGQRYDFINKKVEKTYYYNYSTKHLQDFDLVTDENGMITYTGEVDPQNTYYIELTALDQEGRQTKKRVHIGADRTMSPCYQYYYLQGTTGVSGYKPGENVQLSFMVDNKKLVSSEKSFLYYQGQTLIDHYQVSDEPMFKFEFKNTHIPNVNVYGVYFDGRNYYEASSLSVNYAKELKALQVNIQSDKDEYRPGEEVKMAIDVTDLNNNPVENAEVNLNLVDEALFSLREQNVSFLASLYEDYLYPFLMTRKSHYHPEFGGGAEQGGEGPSERKDFRDTVLFTSLKTDQYGKADVSFKLPDNLTSWRVTYHAFTQNLQAISGTEQIPVRLPFFVEMTMNQVYLAGDSPVMILRSFGEQLRDSQTVTYEMKLVDSKGIEQSWKSHASSFTSTDLKLPKLEAGTYTLTVSAESNGLKDSITKEFSVRDSFQERTVTSHSLLKEGNKIIGSDTKPTTVIFSDYEKSQYIQGLYQLAWNNGSRLEQKLAAQQARKLLAQYFPDEQNYFLGEEQESLLIYQRPDGGISILPYAESELALSAMVAASTSGIFDERPLAGYFYRVLEGKGSEDDKSLALLGLAALREPVLLQINDYLHNTNLEPAVKINLALALLEIGNGAYAKEVYSELISLYSEDLGSIIRVNVGRDQDEIVEATTQMALLAARLDQAEKNKLYQYLLENPGNDILTTIEQLQILKYNLQYMKSSPVRFSYEINGGKITKSLKGTELFKLTLLPEDLNKIQFSNVEGKVGMVSRYSVPIQAGEKGMGQDLNISRTYWVNNNKVTNFNRTDLVKVVITYNISDKAPGGIYEVVDVLPAGLAHISRPYNYYENRNQNWDYPTEVDGQKLVFFVGKGKNQITYLARVLSPGEFNSEAPVLSNIKNSTIFTSGSKGGIVIQ